MMLEAERYVMLLGV